MFSRLPTLINLSINEFHFDDWEAPLDLRYMSELKTLALDCFRIPEPLFPASIKSISLHVFPQHSIGVVSSKGP
jgi:hypothetical protein